ncbi:MAG: autotransporter outer membrane beta-barrel domain-containing protein [Rhizobiaceae bacterium]
MLTGSGSNGDNEPVIEIDAQDGSNGDLNGTIVLDQGTTITGGSNGKASKGGNRDGIEVNDGANIEFFIEGQIFADNTGLLSRSRALDLKGNSNSQYTINIGVDEHSNVSGVGQLGNSADDQIIRANGGVMPTTINNYGTLYGNMAFGGLLSDWGNGAVTINNYSVETWNTSGPNIFTNNNDTINNDGGVLNTDLAISFFSFRDGADKILNQNGGQITTGAASTTFFMDNGEDQIINDTGSTFTTGNGVSTDFYFDTPEFLLVVPIPFSETADKFNDKLENKGGSTFNAFGSSRFFFGGGMDTFTNTNEYTQFNTSGLTTFSFGTGEDTFTNTDKASFTTSEITSFFFDNPDTLLGFGIPFTQNGDQANDTFTNSGMASFTAGGATGFYFGGGEDTFNNTGTGTVFTANDITLFGFGTENDTFWNQMGATFHANDGTGISFGDGADKFWNTTGATFNNSALNVFSFGSGADEFWNTQGAIFNVNGISWLDFGSETDVANNSSTINVAGTLNFLHLENFNNGGGLIDMRNSNILPDSTNIWNGGNFNGGAGSMLGIDATLTPGGAADFLYVSGDATGATEVKVADLDGGPGMYDPDGVMFARVDGSSDDGDFFTNGGIEKGFFTYDVFLNPDTSSGSGENEWVLANYQNKNAFAVTGIAAGANNFWHQGAGTWLERTSDLRSQINNGEYGLQMATDSDGDAIKPSAWVKAYGANEERDISRTIPAPVGGGSITLNDNFDQDHRGILAGIDRVMSSNNGTWLLGAFGGYGTSDLSYASGANIDLSAASVGAYATYMRDALYVDMLVKADFGEADFTSPGVGTSFDTDFRSIGGVIDAGYRINGAKHFIEPQATLAYVHTDFDGNPTAAGVAVNLDSGDSLRGRIGARLGTEVMTEKSTVEPYIEASLWNEFNGDYSATIGVMPGAPVSYDAEGAFGEIAVGVDVAPISGKAKFFAKGSYLSGDDYEGISYNAGVRINW